MWRSKWSQLKMLLSNNWMQIYASIWSQLSWDIHRQVKRSVRHRLLTLMQQVITRCRGLVNANFCSLFNSAIQSRLTNTIVTSVICFLKRSSTEKLAAGKYSCALSARYTLTSPRRHLSQLGLGLPVIGRSPSLNIYSTWQLSLLSYHSYFYLAL